MQFECSRWEPPVQSFLKVCRGKTEMFDDFRMETCMSAIRTVPLQLRKLEKSNMVGRRLRTTDDLISLGLQNLRTLISRT